MNLARVKMPKFVMWLFPHRIWAFPLATNEVYLTFDDGPIPIVTPWVLKTLKKYNARATFFCIGANVAKHPAIFHQIIDEGHAIGNHTYHHIPGWKSPTETYLKDIEKCELVLDEKFKEKQALLKRTVIKRPKLFRPPFGKMSAAQAKKVKRQGYSILMWNVLTMDYDVKISEEKCLTKVLKHIKPGSIVVFHDSLKAQKNLQYILPRTLDHIFKKGWKCEAIDFKALRKNGVV